MRLGNAFRLASFVAIASLLPAWFGLSQGAAQAAQSSASVTLKDFAGAWNWMFEGKRFATMTLKLDGDQITGSTTHGFIDMDDNGKITSATAAEGESPIVRSSLQDGVLHIVTKKGDDELDFAMTLTSPTTAELRFEGEGAPKNAEPVRLEKAP